MRPKAKRTVYIYCSLVDEVSSHGVTRYQNCQGYQKQSEKLSQPGGVEGDMTTKHNMVFLHGSMLE